jgi:hypothetical protein
MAICSSGATKLPLVTVDTHSSELRDGGGFLGDRASRRAFRAILDDWRERIHEIVEHDPLADMGGRLTKKRLDRIFATGSSLAAGLLHTAIEEFAAELAEVALRFLELDDWRDTERIVVGGGLSGSRIGEIMIGRAAVLLKAAGHPILMNPVRYNPDEAGIIGATRLAPSWALRWSDAMLAVDIGGSNIRAGLVALGLDHAPDLSDCKVTKLEHWRYANEARRPTRKEAVDRLVRMLETLVATAKKQRLRLSPLIGVACPGNILPDGTIERGGQNLPGNWESKRFNLTTQLSEAIPLLGGHPSHVIMHNDAVVQGLAEAPFMRDVRRWGVLTIGTGLGNARFTNRKTTTTASKKSTRSTGAFAHAR